MKRKRKSDILNSTIERLIVVALFFLCISSGAFGQKVTRQSAVNAFSQMKYESALEQFSGLLSSYPGDPVYKYYYGATLVELRKDPVRASLLLNQAAYESGTIRSVPPDCFFYLGRALQMRGKFQDAIQAYNRFTSLAGKKTSKELDVPDLIKQCNEQKGALEIASQVTEPAPHPDKKDSVIQGVLEAQHTDTIPAEWDRQMEQALEARIKEDSLARTGESGKRLKILPDSINSRTKEPVSPGDTSKIVVTKDSARINPVTVRKELPVFSEFNIEPKAASKTEKKIAVDPAVPPGLIYRIQVAVFRNPVLPAFFKGISPVQGFKNPSTGVTVYYAGRFRRSADAGQAMLKVKSTGFRDAFIVALMDKKVVSNDRAALLEKEWGSKPLFTEIPVVEQIRDTIPPTLMFRVEVKRSGKPLPEDQIESMRRMAAGKGFDIVSPDLKHFIYLIGKFFTYTSAAEYADLLLRNGYKEARVAAWLGNKEIPVETARNLFEQKQ